MKHEELKIYYKTAYNFSKKTGMSAGSYKFWLDQGYIPIKSQYYIEAISGGALTANIEDDKPIIIKSDIKKTTCRSCINRKNIAPDDGGECVE